MHTESAMLWLQVVQPFTWRLLFMKSNVGPASRVKRRNDSAHDILAMPVRSPHMLLDELEGPVPARAYV